MRLSSKDAREFKALAEGFGWRLAGVTSNGHLRWTHHAYGELVTSCTPSSWWWAKRDLYAAMGTPLPARSRRRSRAKRAPQEPNGINALLRMARGRGHPMDASFAEKLLADHHGSLPAALTVLHSLLDRADRIRLKRERAARKHQPWHPRPVKSLCPPRALAETVR